MVWVLFFKNIFSVHVKSREERHETSIKHNATAVGRLYSKTWKPDCSACVKWCPPQVGGRDQGLIGGA